MDEEDEDDDMNDDGDDSFGEDGDDEMLSGGSELTTQLAAAGWQHGVKFCFVLYFNFRQSSTLTTFSTAHRHYSFIVYRLFYDLARHDNSFVSQIEML